MSDSGFLVGMIAYNSVKSNDLPLIRANIYLYQVRNNFSFVIVLAKKTLRVYNNWLTGKGRISYQSN